MGQACVEFLGVAGMNPGNVNIQANWDSYEWSAGSGITLDGVIASESDHSYYFDVITGHEVENGRMVLSTTLDNNYKTRDKFGPAAGCCGSRDQFFCSVDDPSSGSTGTDGAGCTASDNWINGNGNSISFLNGMSGDAGNGTGEGNYCYNGCSCYNGATNGCIPTTPPHP